MLLVLYPRNAVANVFPFIKTHSDKMLKAKFLFLQKVYSGKKAFCQEDTVYQV